MNIRRFAPLREGQRGSSLIEVLVSLVILLVGLLGLTGVMIQSQRSQMESYERVQALLLAEDMASRLNVNRKAPLCYVVANAGQVAPGAVTANCSDDDDAAQEARASQDLSDWHSLLAGAAETLGGSSVGAILGARGCVEQIDADLDGTFDENVYQITVAWQGQSLGGVPGGDSDADGVGDIGTCGVGSYGASDGFRRAVSVRVQAVSL